MTSHEENVLIVLIQNERWDDSVARVNSEEGREELRRKYAMQIREIIANEGVNKFFGCYLPLHWVFIFRAPFELVLAMVDEYPEAVRASGYDGRLPIHLACRRRGISTRSVRLLLDEYPEGAKATEENGQLPLHMAALNHAPLEVLRMLVDAHPEGAATRCIEGFIPLDCLANTAVSPDKKEDVEKVEILLRPLLDNEEACLVPHPDSGKTPLHIAAEFDLLRLHTYLKIPRCPAEVIMKVLARHPGQLWERDEHGSPPLHVAAADPHLNGAQVKCEDLVSTLVLLHPEAAESSDVEGRSPLSLAIESGKKWNEGVEAMTDAAEHVITVRDVATGLFPFMLAATVDDPCIDTVYGLLRRCPELKRYNTSSIDSV